VCVSLWPWLGGGAGVDRAPAAATGTGTGTTTQSAARQTTGTLHAALNLHEPCFDYALSLYLSHAFCPPHSHRLLPLPSSLPSGRLWSPGGGVTCVAAGERGPERLHRTAGRRPTHCHPTSPSTETKLYICLTQMTQSRPYTRSPQRHPKHTHINHPSFYCGGANADG
jgi:hypothetical protein